jgi:biopolymer transport protein ExbD
MLKKLLILLFAFVVTIPLARAVFAQEAAAQAKKEARWEGRVVRSNKDLSTLTVRKAGSTLEKTVKYDASTKWVSQYHADKKINNIDASQVKDEDYVICLGTWDKDNALHATQISKRLSHSPE